MLRPPRDISFSARTRARARPGCTTFRNSGGAFSTRSNRFRGKRRWEASGGEIQLPFKLASGNNESCRFCDTPYARPPYSSSLRNIRLACVRGDPRLHVMHSRDRIRVAGSRGLFSQKHAKYPAARRHA